MSYGSEAANGAASAGSAASTAGTTASTVGTMGEGASMLGSAGESGAYMNALGQTQPQAGFSLGAAEGAGAGPTTTNAANIPEASWWDKTVNFLDDYQRGKEANIGQAWKNRGLNGHTVGYVGGKLEGMMKGGGGSTQAAPVTINNTYDQPENEYLKRYMLLQRRG